MAWTAPPTFVSGNVLTAAQLNVLSGDLNETGPAKATTPGQYFVATGTNAITARTVGRDSVLVAESTTSTAFTDLTTFGPQVTVTTGTYVLMCMQAQLANNTVNGICTVGLDISGATTLAAGTIWLSFTSGTANQQITCGTAVAVIGLTAGSNTFTMKYVVGSGTGTFHRRWLTILPF
jgi:hypothetical protein